jgi:stalled ribosome rescue protein Dom34
MIKENIVVDKKSTRKTNITLTNENTDFDKIANKFRIYFEKE